MIKLVVIGMAVIVLGAGGLFAYSKLAGGSAQAPGSNTEKDFTLITVPLKSFIVNLMDKGGMGKRYLKVTMELEIAGEQNKTLLDEKDSQVRDTILLLLSSLSFSEVGSMEGKLQLKQSLQRRINEVLGNSLVSRIYFTEFVVQ